MTEQQLPEGWQMVKFGDIAKHISKRVEPSETELEVYVGLEHLDPDSLKIKRHGVPSDVAGQKLLVKKGQIIFGKRRAYQRKVAVADWDCICSAHAMVLEANPKNVLPEFLPFFMQSDVFMNRAVAISEGSLSPTIKWKVLEAQVFAIPSIHSQESLCNILKSLDAKIETRHSLIQSTKNLLQALRDDLWTKSSDLAKCENGFKSLSDLFVNTSGTALESYVKDEGSYHFISIGNYSRDGRYIDKNQRVLPESKPLTKKLSRDDLVMVLNDKSSTGDIIGSTIYISVDDKFIFNQRSEKLTPKEGVFSRFYWHVLNSSFFRKRVFDISQGGTQIYVNFSELKKQSVPFPDFDVQKLKSKGLDHVFFLQEELELRSVADAKLKQEILHHYLGRVYEI